MSAIAAKTSSKLAFPHPSLSIIVGTPNNSSLQALQKQMFANARAIHSTRGGGDNGHLALVMPPPAYLVRTGVPFVAPVHPGDAPVHVQGATGPAITETNRRFKHDLAEHLLYQTVTEELKQQLLAAVPTRYLSILEDADYGYSDVSIIEMLTHLRTTYATIEPEEIESNRNALTAAWNPEEPIEDLWNRIQEIQRFANDAQEPITDGAALHLMLSVFEATGVLTTAAEKWRDKPQVDWTMANFQAHFTRATKERARVLTAQNAGFHGANSAVIVPPDGANSASVTSPGAANVIPAGGTVYYYCWTHGLGKNGLHTSASCKNKGEGHKDSATANNMQGGTQRLMTRRRQAPAATPP